jgi:hypothetical protein
MVFNLCSLQRNSCAHNAAAAQFKARHEPLAWTANRKLTFYIQAGEGNKEGHGLLQSTPLALRALLQSVKWQSPPVSRDRAKCNDMLSLANSFSCLSLGGFLKHCLTYQCFTYP